jgi:hypothetical protein
MKLLYCNECGDIIKLKYRKVSFCQCARAWGIYVNTLDAVHYNGVPIGIENKSFFAALEKRPSKGAGRIFKAFVIPEDCETITQAELEND